MMNRRFTKPYQSANGAINIQPGAIAYLIQFVDEHSIDVEVDGQTYTLPIVDFIQATINFGEWTAVGETYLKTRFTIEIDGDPQ